MRHAFANKLEQLLADSLDLSSVAGSSARASATKGGEGRGGEGKGGLVARSIGHRVASSGVLVAPNPRGAAGLSVEDYGS